MLWLFWLILAVLIAGSIFLARLARRGNPLRRRRTRSGRHGFRRALLASLSYLLWAMGPRMRPWNVEPPADPGKDYADDWDRSRRRRH